MSACKVNLIKDKVKQAILVQDKAGGISHKV